MSPDVFALFCAFVAVATATVIVALLAGRGAVGLGRVSLAGLVALALVQAFRAVPLPRTLSTFGTLQLVYLLGVCVVPAAGLAVLLARAAGRPVTRGATGIAAFGASLSLVGVWATFVEPQQLRLEEATLRAQAALVEPLRIGVLADVQCSRITGHERDAVARLMAEEPDLVLVAGDLFQGTAEHFARCRDEFAALLASLAAPGGVWFVRGDVDGGREFEELAAAAGLQVLRDASTVVEVRGQRVELYGVDRWTNDREALLGFLATPRAPGAARVVLAHRPDPILGLAEDLGAAPDLDLFVAGHTHGGQVQVPFLGPLITLSRVPRPVAAGGLHRVDGVPIYVSRGVGMERGHAPRIRFNCLPDVSVVTLLPTELPGG